MAAYLWLVSGIASAQNEINIAALAQDPQWLALLHFGRSGDDYRTRSYVDDSKFFFAPEGASNPEAELKQTLAVLEKVPAERCRFMARTQWLQARGLLPESGREQCSDYQQWRKRINVGQVALVFASSYLNSPSSMYGHTFLRLDPKGYRSESALLSYAVNYAAFVPENDGSLLFAWRGMSGGYPGQFSLQPYVEKLQEYSRLENRDVWEYQLNLTDAEIDRLLAHLWELQAINFDYYFMDENCSFRLLELLEVARPGLNLTGDFPLHAIPVDTVRSVRDAKLIDEVTYRPSRQQELETLLQDFDRSERRAVIALAESEAYLTSEAFQRQSASQQYPLLLAAYRLLRYRHDREARDAKIARHSFRLLKAINALPREAKPDKRIHRPPQPDAGHDTALAALAAGQWESQDYAELTLKLTYHDLLDPIAGYPVDASLNMLSATLRQTEDESLRVQEVDVVDIRSLAPRNRFFRPVSWQARAGLERGAWDDEFLASFAEGGAGGTWRMLGGRGSVLATLRAEYNESFDHNWQAAPGLSLRWGLQGQRIALELEASHYRFNNGVERNDVALSAQWHVTRQQGLRLRAARRGESGEWGEQVSLQWRVYF
ncbi:hypothetical protein FHR99_002826 [Litorivivens lipolytica]|uniref:DUF4105 domain-containing protein n=1 Tax=Litorivivens lipolytica TaxID=1524264 RepID=A0A7W4W821_9GAMM|nr:hypothetical protein [Litorivivens lipolytica]